MYRFLYNNYTFWVKKNLKGLQGIQGPTLPSPPTNFSFLSDHSPTPVLLTFYYPWNVPSISLPQGFCTCLPFCLGSSSSKYPMPPLEFYWKVPCSAKFTLPTLIKFINSPPIRAYPPYLLHLPLEYLSSQSILHIYLLPVSLLKSRGMWERGFHLLLSLLCL